MKQRIFLMVLFAIFVSALVAQNDKKEKNYIKRAKENPEVKKFLEKFNKDKFLGEIETERDRYEEMVLIAKKNNVTNSDIITKYQRTRDAYNKVLTYMEEDIAKVKNIIGFTFFDSEQRYASHLEAAQKTGAQFTEAVLNNNQLAEQLPLRTPIMVFAKMVLFPLLEKVHDMYLKFCKENITTKIERTKFRSWEEIN